MGEPTAAPCSRTAASMTCWKGGALLLLQPSASGSGTIWVCLCGWLAPESGPQLK